MTIEKLKSKRKMPSGNYLANIILSDGSFKIVIVAITDEENEIVLLKTNGKKMASEKGWTFKNGFYYKECFVDELNNNFHFNYSIPN